MRNEKTIWHEIMLDTEITIEYDALGFEKSRELDEIEERVCESNYMGNLYFLANKYYNN